MSTKTAKRAKRAKKAEQPERPEHSESTTSATLATQDESPDSAEGQDEEVMRLTPEEEEILRQNFAYIANVFKKNLCIIVQEVTFPNDPRGDIVIDHCFKPEVDEETGVLKEVVYSLLFWKSGVNHRRHITPEHAVLIVLNLLENHETTPQFMYECGQNIKVAYGQLPPNMYTYAILISRLEDMDFDDVKPTPSELKTRNRYKKNYLKYVEHFRKICAGIMKQKGKELPIFPPRTEPGILEASPMKDTPEKPEIREIREEPRRQKPKFNMSFTTREESPEKPEQPETPPRPTSYNGSGTDNNSYNPYSDCPALEPITPSPVTSRSPIRLRSPIASEWPSHLKHKLEAKLMAQKQHEEVTPAGKSKSSTQTTIMDFGGSGGSKTKSAKTSTKTTKKVTPPPKKTTKTTKTKKKSTTKRQNKCGLCGELGHNRRKCPKNA